MLIKRAKAPAQGVQVNILNLLTSICCYAGEPFSTISCCLVSSIHLYHSNTWRCKSEPSLCWESSTASQTLPRKGTLCPQDSACYEQTVHLTP